MTMREFLILGLLPAAVNKAQCPDLTHHRYTEQPWLSGWLAWDAGVAASQNWKLVLQCPEQAGTACHRGWLASESVIVFPSCSLLLSELVVYSCVILLAELFDSFSLLLQHLPQHTGILHLLASLWVRSKYGFPLPLVKWCCYSSQKPRRMLEIHWDQKTTISY